MKLIGLKIIRAVIQEASLLIGAGLSYGNSIASIIALINDRKENDSPDAWQCDT
jgi:hypothetical protein